MLYLIIPKRKIQAQPSDNHAKTSHPPTSLTPTISPTYLTLSTSLTSPTSNLQQLSYLQHLSHYAHLSHHAHLSHYPHFILHPHPPSSLTLPISLASLTSLDFSFFQYLPVCFYNINNKWCGVMVVVM